MSMFNIFGVSGSAISAQAQRLNVVASNLANEMCIRDRAKIHSNPFTWGRAPTRPISCP